MDRTVLPAEAFFSAVRTVFSVSASRLAVISSRRRMGGSAAMARAMERSCHCPWEKRPGVQGVS